MYNNVYNVAQQGEGEDICVCMRIVSNAIEESDNYVQSCGTCELHLRAQDPEEHELNRDSVWANVFRKN